ncbi:hypothetical protein BC629DRAFT_1162472 [Irpex lacteus]|nr:hypothetical protein BC629DRAFT_1162472 [Irpex lacteus]
MRTEGFLPSLRFKASMLIIHGFREKRPLESVLHATKKAVALEGFNENTLRYLLGVVYVNVPSSSAMIESIVELFLQTRPANYKLSERTHEFIAYLHTRLGSPELAAKWVPPPEIPEEAISQDRRRLLALAASDPKLQPIVQAAILRLDQNDKEHDRTLYNSLIEVFLKKQEYTRALQIYRLMVNTGEAISPNSTTFKLLFDAWMVASEPRTFRTRKYKMPSDAPSPRKLFQSMIYFNKRSSSSPENPSPVVSVYSLTAALQAFIKQDDYPAAFTVLRTFTLHGLKPTVEVYTIIVSGLIRRIRYELRFTPPGTDVREASQWVQRFLGHRHPPNTSDDSVFIEAILSIGLQPKLTLNPVTLPTQTQLGEFLFWSGPRKSDNEAVKKFMELSSTPYRIPGTLVVIGILKAWDDKWDVVPLERILRRAILATYAKLFVRPAKAVSNEIAQAKREMVYVE